MKPDELSLMLGEMRGDIKSILKGQEEMKSWQDTHDEKDTNRFTRLHTRLDGMNKYAASIALVAGAIGAGFSYIVDYIKGN